MQEGDLARDRQAGGGRQIGFERPPEPKQLAAIKLVFLAMLNGCCSWPGLDKYIPEFGKVVVQPESGLNFSGISNVEINCWPRIGFAAYTKEGADVPVEAKRPILLKHLLCHCSGSPNMKGLQ